VADGQALAEPHAKLAVQVCCIVADAHLVEVGAHSPAHIWVMAEQENWQTGPVLVQAPVAPHVCGWRPLHRVSVGTHAPVQLATAVPPGSVQRNGHVMVVVHDPVIPHV
jgi:hypothetical protein